MSKTETAPKLYRLADVDSGLLDSFDSFADKLEAAQRSGRPMGPVTGFYKLDRELCGCLQPGLHALAGNTGAGKTALALQIAANCGAPALYVSCEMSALELLRRHTARVTETDLGRFKDPKHPRPLSAAEAKDLVRQAAARAPMLQLIDATQAAAPADYIEAAARNAKADLEAEHVLVIVDSLHSWADWTGGEEYERLNAALQSLRTLAAALAAPVLFIAEQNREANKQKTSAGANAGAGTRRIEYGAETVINLYAPEEEPDILTGEKPVTITLPKNRNGAPGKPLHFQFCGRLQSFRED